VKLLDPTLLVQLVIGGSEQVRNQRLPLHYKQQSYNIVWFKTLYEFKNIIIDELALTIRFK
jgi:hypothetical protein